jgi:peptidyl-dipeptidase A
MHDPARSSPSAPEFLESAEAELLDLSIESQRAEWVHATYLNVDTADLAARAFARRVRRTVDLARAWQPWESSVGLSESARRKGKLLRISQSLVAPSTPGDSEELAHRVAAMEGRYATFRCPLPGRSEPQDLQALSEVLSESRDPSLLRAAWEGWHEVGRPMQPEFLRYVDLANRGARELGFSDTGEMWRSRYDMPSEEVVHEVDRLWSQVAPLYGELHRWVRGRLAQRYGDLVPTKEPLPAHLLGNMWAQSWEPIFSWAAPTEIVGTSDLTRVLRSRSVEPREMVGYAERFFVSLGFEPLPPTFWERSMFSRPRDREVVCHASAWDLDFDQDVRIKMCIETTGEEFQVIHHELGHTYYQLACRHQPFLFRDSAHDGFHEALGDLIGLSVTKSYLAQVGLAETGETQDPSLGELLRIALDKLPFLPFSVAMDRWRWEVFAGRINSGEWNRRWWELRRELQGIAPPSPRAEDAFDPGAKYHIAASVPYLRYFFAYILQFQMHRALAREAGWAGPLHEFTLYGNRAAGTRLRTMMEMGQSRPWPEALEAVSGESRMDAAGLLEYFEPLREWLLHQDRDLGSSR